MQATFLYWLLLWQGDHAPVWYKYDGQLGSVHGCVAAGRALALQAPAQLAGVLPFSGDPPLMHCAERIMMALLQSPVQALQSPAAQ